jgi:quercetin dioxygenase-like cupin family protein
MKIIKASDLDGMGRKVTCPNDGFTSYRFLLEEDGMGYSMTKTVIPKGDPQHWHYKDHLESCYCVSGSGTITNLATGDSHEINPDTTYVLDKNDDHLFQAHETVTLICVFNPPLKGAEVHNLDGSYTAPEAGFRSPVYDVRRVPIDKIKANDYNPNSVAPPEMKLLEISIWEDGYTQPVVSVYDSENDEYVVVDGFHRFLTLKNSPRIMEREQGMLPLVVLDKAIGERMASTIRHNRARGSHNVELMSTIVSELVEMGKGDAWICKHIGMSADELLRLKQITGVAALFQNRDFTESWNAEGGDVVLDDGSHISSVA